MWEYGQYCPIARATEILADRWTLLIVRELLDGVHHFNELDRSLPGVSRALLVERLRRLEQTGVIVRRSHPERYVEYHLTRAGRELQRIIDVLGGWGARWAFGDPRPSELDPVLLLWWMRRHVHRDRLPEHRVVVQFDFHGGRHGTYWLIFNRTDVSLCLQHPRFEVDVRVLADITALYRVWLGREKFGEALAKRQIRLEGPAGHVRAFSRWFAWSPMSKTVRAATASTQNSRARTGEQRHSPALARMSSRSKLTEPAAHA
jgi:DNA-binding HxlR family transcriptional regulator